VTFCAAAAPDISASAPSPASRFLSVLLNMTLSLDEFRGTIGQAFVTA
jgi:hypothetical protein